MMMNLTYLLFVAVYDIVMKGVCEYAEPIWE
nr:MAG TPA: hypothetical protein [Caudoviricetes sp.]